MYDIGDRVPLTFKLPANATNVDLFVYLPDNTTETVSDVTGTDGVYTHDYPTAQVGRHQYRWVATGTNSAASTGVFEVRPELDETFVELDEVKNYLNYPLELSDDDGELRDTIAAATAVVEYLVGAVAVRTVTELLDGSNVLADGYNYGAASDYNGVYRRNSAEVQCTIKPVISVTEVVEIYGNTPQTLTEVETPDATQNPFGFSFDGETGVITKKAAGWPTSWPPGIRNVKVTYQAGRVRTPANIAYGTKELIRHLWTISQNNAEGRRPRTNRAEPVTVVMGYAVPNRVLEMLGADRRTPGMA